MSTTTEFVKIGTRQDLEPHGQFSRWIEDHDVLVYELDGDIKALSNICPHFGGPVGFHKRRNGVFTCLWHNYRFRDSDGHCLSHPKHKLREYKVQFSGDDILVQLVED